MKRYLRYDQEARELRLVMDDLWDGLHEHLEWRLPNTRRGAEWDGKEVGFEHGPSGGYFVRHTVPGWATERIRVETDDSPPVVSSKTPCPRLASASGRAKCQACRDLGFQETPKRRKAGACSTS